MFNIGVGEILIVLVVAFVIVGPDDLPRVARWLGRQVRRLRTLIREVKAETGWDELEKEVKDAQREVKTTVRELDVSADLKSAVKDVKGELESASKGVEQDIRQVDQGLKQELKAADDGVREAVKAAGETAEEGQKEDKAL